MHPRSDAPPHLLRRGVRVIEDRSGDWPLYEVVPVGVEPQRRIVYVHGGAWISQIAFQHWRLVAGLAAETGAGVVVPIYPLAPQGTAATVVPRVAELLQRLVDDHGAERVSVVGDSAGGQIALSAALMAA